MEKCVRLCQFAVPNPMYNPPSLAREPATLGFGSLKRRVNSLRSSACCLEMEKPRVG